MVPDLQELSDFFATLGLRIAYENWCWSTHAPTWRAVWNIVRKVDRPNVGLCLDTFQTAGSEWADPTTASGLIEDVPRDELERRFRASLQDLELLTDFGADDPFILLTERSDNEIVI